MEHPSFTNMVFARGYGDPVGPVLCKKIGQWLKMKELGTPQVLVFGSICQGAILVHLSPDPHLTRSAKSLRSCIWICVFEDPQNGRCVFLFHFTATKKGVPSKKDTPIWK